MRRDGYTLAEMIMATALLVLAVTATAGGYLFFLRGERVNAIQSQLDMDARKTVERLRRDLRLSAVEKMVFYPAGPGPYTAISFPLARDDDGDGLIETDADGKIIWDQTVIYHVWSGSPQELRITTLNPRDNTMTPAQRQEQLNQVVAAGNAAGVRNGANASTRVLFQNLVEWQIQARDAVYDGYSATARRDVRVPLGAVILSTGNHRFRFVVAGKNALSSGYRIGSDTLFVSPCGADREAEEQLPVNAQSGVAAAEELMPGDFWDGNYRLVFPASGADQYFELNLENDRWEETNFRATGQTFQDTRQLFDTSLARPDNLVRLHGLDYAWQAMTQTGEPAGALPTNNVYAGFALRVLLRGDQVADGGALALNGGKCWVGFRGGSSPSFKIKAASIARCADPTAAANPMNAAAGSFVNLTFSSGAEVEADAYRWSDLTSFPIQRTNSYLVTYLLDSNPLRGAPWVWNSISNTSFSTYLLPSGTVADVTTAAWSGRADLLGTPAVIGVDALYTTYPTNGFYTSRILDTQVAAPTYQTILWDALKPSGTTLELKVRAGNQPDLSDAAGWSNLAAIAASGSAISPGAKRFVQFQARLAPDSAGLNSPRLKRVVIRWAGEPRATEIGGTFSKGPDHGIFRVLVDDLPLVRAMDIQMEIFKDIALLDGRTRRMTSSFAMEVEPRNSGK